MTAIYFLVRYTPFWAIPILLIGGEFAYLFWLRKKKRWMTLCASLATFSFFMTIFYYWAGGPEKSVRYVMKFVHYYFY